MNAEHPIPARRYTLSLGDESHEAEVWQEGHEFRVRIGARVHRVSLASIDNGRLFSLLVDGDSYELYARREGSVFDLLVGTQFHRIEAERGHRRAPVRLKPESGELMVRSPMTGSVVEVVVSSGQTVERGEVLLILESMKMNNELRSERAGTIESIAVTAGQRVERGATLLQFRA